MEIKTVVFRLDNAADFDNAVNTALSEGWHLVKRDVIHSRQPHNTTNFFHPMLYAELAKLPVAEAPEPMTVQDAAWIIKQECDRHEHCDTCPIEHVCNTDAPFKWDATRLPEENHD